MRLLVVLLIATVFVVPFVRADGEEVDVDDTNAGSGDEERSEFIQFQVEEVLDTFESNDIGEVINLFADDAQGLWNGASLSNKAAIQETLAPFLDLLAHTRFSVTSPIHENNRRKAIFTRTMYLESLVGCIAVVRSLEELSFDENGKITSFRSEWDQPTAHVTDELNCKTDDKDRLRDELTPEKQKLSDVVHELTEAYEQMDAAEVTSFFTDDAVATLGEMSAEGKEKIQEQYQAMFSRARNFVSTPVSNIFIRDNYASFLANTFIVTSTGCSSVTTVLAHITFTDGKISRLERSLVGMDAKEYAEWLQQDCGDKDSDEGEGEGEGQGGEGEGQEQDQQQQDGQQEAQQEL